MIENKKNMIDEILEGVPYCVLKEKYNKFYTNHTEMFDKIYNDIRSTMVK